MNAMQLGFDAVERGWVPDYLARLAIRRLCSARLRQSRRDHALGSPIETEFRASLRRGPIAPAPAMSNRQHYELPAEFFTAVLGPRRKYSCCYFSDPRTTLAEAEEAALNMTCQRADVADGQRILELGCGWGALSLWMAERYPQSRITAVSNSASQKVAIDRQAQVRGLGNLQVVTADVNDFVPAR